MTRILVTGGSGFIGSRVVAQLGKHGFDVVAVARNPPANASTATCRWVAADLVEHGAEVIRQEKPSQVLHLAWDARHGIYWTSRENLLWVGATAAMIDAFAEVGGARFVMAGTCAEYDWLGPDHDFLEGATPLRPATLYGVAKQSAGELLIASAARFGFSAAVGRIYFCYGQGEPPERLVSYVCRQLAANQEALISSGTQVRDFMHVDDVASGLVALLTSDLQGAVNIASGEGRALADIVTTIGRLAARPHLIRLGAREDRPGDPARIVGDNRRLRSTGWAPQIDFEHGLRKILEAARDGR